MKNKFFLAAMAFTLPLAGCNFNPQSLMFWKKDQNTNDNGSIINNEPTEEQINEAHKLNKLVFDIVEDAYDESIASSINTYIDSYCLEAVTSGADFQKVDAYLAELKSKEDFLEAGEYFVEIKADDGLDDLVYFGTALGKSMLRAVSIKMPEQKALCESAIATIEATQVDLNANLIATLDGVVKAFDQATSASFLDDATSLIDQRTSKINSAKLKKVLTKGGDIISEFIKIKENVKFIASFSQVLTNLVVNNLSVSEDPTTSASTYYLILKIYNLIDTPAVVDSVFDGLKLLAENAKSMSNEYYSYLDSLNNPIENYAYAALGLLEEVYNDIEIPREKAVEGVNSLLNFVRETYALLKDMIGAPEIIDQIIGSEKTRDLLVSVAILFADIVNAKSDAINAKSLAKVAVTIFQVSSVSSSIYSDTFLPDCYPEEVVEQIDVDEMESNLEEGYSYEISYVTPITVTDDGTQMVSKYYFYAYNSEYYCEWTDAVVDNLEPIVQFLYDLCDEIATRVVTDQIVDDILDIVYRAYLLCNELGLFEELEEDELILIEKIASLYKSSDLIQKFVRDLFVTFKNLLSSFIEVDGVPADIDITEAVLLINIDEFELPLNSLQPERLNGFKDLLEDIYNIIDELGYIDAVLGFLNQIIEGIDKTENASEFAEIIYALVEESLVVQAN